MPTTIFDWIARTAMLVMAGLVTLSILGAISAMTSDPGTRFATPGDRPPIERQQAEERQPAPVPSVAEEGNSAASVEPSQIPDATVAAARPVPQDKVARWLEAIAYALLAIAGVGALGVLMLWSILRELRRSGRPPH